MTEWLDDAKTGAYLYGKPTTKTFTNPGGAGPRYKKLTSFNFVNPGGDAPTYGEGVTATVDPPSEGERLASEVDIGTKSGGTVGKFISHINKSGIARKNRYKVFVEGRGPNAAARAMGSFHLADLNLMCESVSFPAQNLRATPDALRFGPEREQVQGVTYGEVSASFICSSDMREKIFFTEWHKKVFNKNTWDVNYYNMFIGSMRIIQDDRFDQQVYGVELSEVYPKTITQMELGYAQNDTYHSLSIDFQYHRWKELGSVRNIGQDY